jgi:hypothetical protein
VPRRGAFADLVAGRVVSTTAIVPSRGRYCAGSRGAFREGELDIAVPVARHDGDA